MKMLEAFQELLKGGKLIRDDWDGTYIQYNEDRNTFEAINKIGNRVPVSEVCFRNVYGKSIIFRDILSKHNIIEILDDDNTKVHTAEESTMEIDAMKWRIHEYVKNTSCNECKMKNFNGCRYANYYTNKCDLEDFKNIETGQDFNIQEIKQIYNLIKEDI